MSIFDVTGPTMVGIWDYDRYRALSAPAEGRPVLAHALEGREAAARTGACAHAKASPTCAVLADAVDAICLDAARIAAAAPVSAADALVWLWICDMLCASSCLACVPEYRSEGGVCVADALTTVACVLDDVAGATMGGEGVRSRRSRSEVYVDLVGRRQAVWLDFADDMGREAALLAGADWDGARDDYGRVRLAQLTRRLGGREHASDLVCVLLALDALMDEGGGTATAGAVAGALRAHVAAELAEAWPEGTETCTGVSRLIMVPRDVRRDMDMAMAAMRGTGVA